MGLQCTASTSSLTSLLSSSKVCLKLKTGVCVCVCVCVIIDSIFGRDGAVPQEKALILPPLRAQLWGGEECSQDST